MLAATLTSTLAYAATLEKLVMPGPVIEAHQQFETDCGSCHANFDRDSQRALCLDCHEDLQVDIESGQGFHSLNPRVVGTECRQCHTEHKGRGADIVGLVPELFDHTLTDFPLAGLHQDTSCNTCHTPATSFTSTESSCVSCHQEDDTHRQQLGTDCGDCHTPQGWGQVTFDHNATTKFALTGAHSDTTCAACHVDQVYENTPATCIGCHEKDDAHNGNQGSQCATCHTTTNWQSAQFDHTNQTGFALLGSHDELSCTSCHLSDMSSKAPPTTCFGCHSANDPHLGKNGEDCKSCHQQDTWSMEFDHASNTDFALNGQHSRLQCSQCHQGALTEEVETTCFACHIDDDPHAGELTDCKNCHNEQSWTSSVEFHHDLTNFPLLGGHQSAACEQCHEQSAFSQALGAVCIDCHFKDDAHEDAFGSKCETCHNPVAWELWQFDHDLQTEFPLKGAHDALVCSSCHQPLESQPPSQTCIGCHRRDDIHRGSFGANCVRCHGVDTFSSPKIGRSG